MTAGIILLMVVSGLIRYVHDSRSSHAATALATMVSTTATVRRVGAGERQIPSEELVVGDIVTLSAGDIVPADCKLLESRDLRIAQGALTGESMPVRKDAAALLAAGARDTALTDAACLVFMGHDGVFRVPRWQSSSPQAARRTVRRNCHARSNGSGRARASSAA